MFRKITPSVTIIANPAAGRGLDLARSVRRRLMAQGAATRLEETRAPMHARELAAQAVARGDRLIVASGGDGTINEVVNGMQASTATLAVLPSGTVNILAALLRLPRRSNALADYVLHGSTRPVRWGVANGRLFTGMLSAGFDALCVHNMNPALKRRIGVLAYGWEAIKEFIGYRPAALRVTVDGTDYACTTAIVLRGPYYAGHYTLAPGARLEDDRLWVCLLEDPSRWALARFALLLPLGRAHSMRGVRLLSGQNVTLAADQPVPVECDGEDFGTTPVDVHLSAEPISLRTPG